MVSYFSVNNIIENKYLHFSHVGHVEKGNETVKLCNGWRRHSRIVNDTGSSGYCRD